MKLRLAAHPPSVRLAGRRPDPAGQSGRLRARPHAQPSKGKTPVLDAAEARTLLDSIDITTPAGLRDRALIALMVYSLARIGAALRMKVEDVYTERPALGAAAGERRQGARHALPSQS